MLRSKIPGGSVGYGILSLTQENIIDNQEKNFSVSLDAQAAAVPALNPQGAARRRFARAGAGATGVILTLQSQPAMATYGKCVSPSGFVSATTGTSLNPIRSCMSNEDPQYWQNNKSRWSSRAFTNPHDRFEQHFRCPNGYRALAKLTLYEVLCRNTYTVKAADPSGISRLCIAAWLNAHMNQQNAVVLTPERVVEIWRQYAETNVFFPAKNASPWGRSTIYDYLRSTFRSYGS